MATYKMGGNSAKKSQKATKKRVKKIRKAQPKIEGSQTSDRLKRIGKSGSTTKAFTAKERYDPKGKEKGSKGREEIPSRESSSTVPKKKKTKSPGPAKFRTFEEGGKRY